MLNENNILINDSCVLFDLVDLRLLRKYFQLEYSFFTTPQVIEEITDDNQISEIEHYINNEILLVDAMGTLESILKLYDNYPGLSFADSSVLELTSRIKGILLSSDKSLRNITKNNNLEVRGVLWIIKELVDERIISKETAIQKLHFYPKINVRAPQKEIKELIVSLQNK